MTLRYNKDTIFGLRYGEKHVYVILDINLGI